MSDSNVRSPLAHYQLTADIYKEQVSDVHLEKISRSLCKDWKRLPSHLEMKTIVADDIDCKQVNEGEKRRQFLVKWKEIKGSSASYECLIRALLEIESRQDAERVCELLQASSGKATHAFDQTIPDAASTGVCKMSESSGRSSSLPRQADINSRSSNVHMSSNAQDQDSGSSASGMLSLDHAWHHGQRVNSFSMVGN